MRRFVTFGICLMLATPTLAATVGEKTGVNSAMGIAPSTHDFITEAAQSDMFELQSSEAALSSGNPAIKAFAQKMITDHGKTTAELKAAVGSGDTTLPTAMNNSQASMLDKLKGLQGGNFDSQYVSDQVSAHKDAIDLFKRYSNGGSDSKLKDWAGMTVPALQEHLKMAQNLTK